MNTNEKMTMHRIFEKIKRQKYERILLYCSNKNYIITIYRKDDVI